MWVGEASTGLMNIPLWKRRSSSAATFKGSAIATTRVERPSISIGIARYFFASSSRMQERTCSSTTTTRRSTSGRESCSWRRARRSSSVTSPILTRVAPRTISALGTASGEIFDPAGGFDELLRAATRHCRRLVDAERVRIWVLRRGGRTLVTREYDDGGGSVEHRTGSGEGLAGWTITQRRPLRLAPDDALPNLTGETPSFRSALVIPLFRRGEAFGVIECLDKRGGGAFTDADFDHLDVASEHVSVALDNAMLVQETQRRAREKEGLLELAKSVATPLDLDEVIEAILKSLREVVNYDAAAIYLVNRSTLALELARDVGYPEGSEGAFGLQIGQGIVGWVAKTGEPLIVPEVARDSRYVAARPSTRSELAAPLVVGGRTIGVFNLESDASDTYHEGHLELVSAFASQAAIAVERARLTRELLE